MRGRRRIKNIAATPLGLLRQAVLSPFSQSIWLSSPSSRSLSANAPSVPPMYRDGGEMQYNKDEINA